MANGLFAGGDGTANNPYLIEDAHDLNAVRNSLSAHYKLIRDIDLDVEPYNEGDGWATISLELTDSLRFKGSIDGNGYAVKGLYSKINGLIGTCYGARIKNLNLINVYIDSGVNQKFVGGLVGHTRYTIIENCNISGVVNGERMIGTGESDIGGLVGRLHNEGIIKNCKSSCEVYSKQHMYMGALIGVLIDSTLANCISIGNKKSLGTQTRGNSKNLFWDRSIYGGNDGGQNTKVLQTVQTFTDAGWGNEKLEDGTKIWTLNDNAYPKLWFEEAVFSLVKSSGKIQTLVNGEWFDTGLTEPLIQEDFKNHGMNNLAIIPSDKWMELDDEFEVITWTDNKEIASVLLRLKTDSFSPMEKLNQEDEFEILTWTIDKINPKLELTIPQFRNIDKLNNEFKIITGRYKPI